MRTIVPLDSLPTGALMGIIALVVVQLSVEVFALVKLLKTPDDRVVFGRKWPWILIILFINLDISRSD